MCCASVCSSEAGERRKDRWVGPVKSAALIPAIAGEMMVLATRFHGIKNVTD